MDKYSWRASIAFAVLVVVCFTGWMAATLEYPGFCLHDEFLTYARTKNLLASGDFLTVTIQGEPSWEKPPLQYWLGASLLWLGLEPTIALRAFPLVFSVLTIFLTVFVALYLSDFKHPWAVLYSVLLLGLSQNFVQQSRAAMLETGFCFFVGLSVLSIWRAQEEPRWWYLWGLSCGLATLQKVPIAWIVTVLVCLPFFLMRRASFLSSLKNGPFARGFSLALLLTAFWPVIQVCRWGGQYWHRTGSETLYRVTRGIGALEDTGMGLNFDRLLFFTQDSSVLYLACFLVLAVLWKTDRLKGIKEDPRVLSIFSFLLVLALGLVVSAGPVYSRYTLIVLPFTTALTAAYLSRCFPSPAACCLFLTLCWTYQGSRIADIPYRGLNRVSPEMVHAATRFGEFLNRDEIGLMYLNAHDSSVHPYLPYDRKVLMTYNLDDLRGEEPVVVLTEIGKIEELSGRDLSIEPLFKGKEFAVVRVQASKVNSSSVSSRDSGARDHTTETL